MVGVGEVVAGFGGVAGAGAGFTGVDWAWVGRALMCVEADVLHVVVAGPVPSRC